MARRTRYDAPKWAEQFPDTPEGMDAMHVEGEVRRHLAKNTDPDDIEDSDVREAYLNRLQQENADGGAGENTDAASPHRVDPRSKRRAGRAGSRPARSTARFSHPLHWGSGSRGQVVGKPTLRPPSGLSTRDWTGFGFGLVLYALGAAYINDGPGGPTRWLKAKFLNDVGSGSLSSLAPTPGSKTPAQLGASGLTPPGAKGLKNPPLTGPGANQPYIQGSDGLWYPATPKAGGLKVTP